MRNPSRDAAGPLPGDSKRRPIGLDAADIATLVEAALSEDLGTGDATTACTVPAELVLAARIIAKSAGVLSGRPLAEMVFERLSPRCRFEGAADGDRVEAGAEAWRIVGPGRAILSGERVALNFLQHLSGIATLTARYVDAVAGTRASISDTRKTTPTLRRIEKYAVRCGGGVNHRFGLDDMLLVKENHIAAAGSLEAAVKAALRAAGERAVEVEVRTLEEFRTAMSLAPARILLDHWRPEHVREAVRLRGGAATLLEVSGNLGLETVREYALAGADILSVGALTHSAPALDLSLLVTGPGA
jgi:nicotinate-nucleotide pyrophosphorylase (carboxylating)